MSVAQLACRQCSVPQEVPGEATSFRCSQCGAVSTFGGHSCGAVTAVPPGAKAWRCAGCGQTVGAKPSRFAAGVAVAYRLTCLVWLAIAFVAIVAVTVAEIRG
jgi:predicted RNA-binding Zn-ribbon protein involved in translation (DUF1610 family)